MMGRSGEMEEPQSLREKGRIQTEDYKAERDAQTIGTTSPRHSSQRHSGGGWALRLRLWRWKRMRLGCVETA